MDFITEPCLNNEDYDIDKWINNIPEGCFPINLTIVPISYKEGASIIQVHKNILNKYINKDYFLDVNNEIIRIIENNVILKKLEQRLNEVIKEKQSVGVLRMIFAKMHRAPIDCDWEERGFDIGLATCSMEVLINFIKSIRIAEDITDYIKRRIPLKIFLQKYEPIDFNNEFRIFVDNRKIILIRRHPLADKPQSNFTKKFVWDTAKVIYNRCFMKKFIHCVIDFELVVNQVGVYVNRFQYFRIFDINPFDETTDLYSKNSVEN
jgi:hypothetical protein